MKQREGLRAGGVVLVILVGLIGWFPYFEGYSDHRFSIFHYFCKSWTDYQGEWKHCLFVPFLVGFLVYLQWPELRQVPVRPAARWGAGILVLALFLYWLGYAAGNNYLGFLSTHVLYAGLILWFLGVRWLQALSFPFLFLVFMWPMGFLDNLIAFQLRVVMAVASHVVLSLIGVANLRSGTAILSAPDFSHGVAAGARFAIDVAEPCSGLHSLFALIMVSFLYGYLTFGLSQAGKPWNWSVFGRVVAMILAAIPLAVLGNIVRIVLLALADLTWGTSFALGTETEPSWFHEFAGYVVFVVALGGIVLFAKGLSSWFVVRGSSNEGEGREGGDGEGDGLSAGFTSSRKPIAHSLLPMALPVPLALALLTLLACHLTPDPTGGSVPGVVMELPSQVGDWWGTEGHMSVGEKLGLPKDTELVRKEYEDGESDQVECSIVLAGAEKRSIHRPEICLPGQGWTIKGGEAVPVTLHSGRVLKVMQLLLSRPVESPRGRQTVYAYFLYWFVGSGVTTPYHWERIWLTGWDRLVHHRNHRWAYVSVISAVTQGVTPSNKSPEETQAMLKKFIADSAPSFEPELK